MWKVTSEGLWDVSVSGCRLISERGATRIPSFLLLISRSMVFVSEWLACFIKAALSSVWSKAHLLCLPVFNFLSRVLCFPKWRCQYVMSWGLNPLLAVLASLWGTCSRVLAISDHTSTFLLSARDPGPAQGLPPSRASQIHRLGSCPDPASTPVERPPAVPALPRKRLSSALVPDLFSAGSHFG